MLFYYTAKGTLTNLKKEEQKEVKVVKEEPAIPVVKDDVATVVVQQGESDGNHITQIVDTTT